MLVPSNTHTCMVLVNPLDNVRAIKGRAVLVCLEVRPRSVIFRYGFPSAGRDVVQNKLSRPYKSMPGGENK